MAHRGGPSGPAVDEVPEPRPGAGREPRPRPARRLGRLRRERRSASGVAVSGALRTARRVRPPSARRRRGCRRPGRPARRARLAGRVQLGARHPVGDGDRARRPGGAGGRRGRRGGAHRYPAGPGRHRPARSTGSRRIPTVASVSVSRSWPSHGGRLGPAQGARSWPSRTLKVNYRSWMPRASRSSVVSALPAGRGPGQRHVRRARPGGHPAPPSRCSQLLLAGAARPGRHGHGDQRRPGHAAARPRSAWSGAAIADGPQEAGRPRGAAADEPGRSSTSARRTRRSPADLLSRLRVPTQPHSPRASRSGPRAA